MTLLTALLPVKDKSGTLRSFTISLLDNNMPTTSYKACNEIIK